MDAHRPVDRRRGQPVTVVLLASLLAAQEEERKEGPRWSLGGILSTDLSALLAPPGARDTLPEEGIAGEYSVRAHLELDRRLSITVRSCVGCHGIEVESVYADLALADGLALRAGRIPVPFGGLSRRTSPAQAESSSRPLPWIMGGMVRRREFNMGIVPAPFVDNGVALQLDQTLRSLHVTLETALVRGLKGASPDINFISSRDFEDMNGEPAGAARLTATIGTLTLGISGSAGHYDAESALAYRMAAADFHLRLGDANLRLEFAGRQTEYEEPARGGVSERWSYVVQADMPLDARVRAFVLHDMLRVEGIRLGAGGPTTVPSLGTTDDENSIFRTAMGLVLNVRAGVQVKASAEYWDLTDFEDTWVFHFEVVVEF